MNILAIDTAMEACSAALLLDGELRERYAVCPREHNARILPMVNELLDESGVSMDAVDLIAFGRGPGAFTGVRVATGVVQGLALAADKPVMGISDLAAMALRAAREHQRSKILVLSDARMGEVYAGWFLVDGDQVDSDGAEVVCAPSDVEPPSTTGWFGAGSGWDRYREELTHLKDHVDATDSNCLPRATEIALLAASRPSGEATPAALARPVYLRDQVVDTKGD